MRVRTVNRTTGQPGSSTSARTPSKRAPRGKPSRSSKAMSSNFHRASVRHSGSAKWRASRRKECEKRSEEHTSELQSLTNLVCRLLLEKKKKKTNTKERQRLKTNITPRRIPHQ